MPLDPTHEPDRRKERPAMKVSDRAAEIGINLNTIVTTILVGVVTWVGSNISDMKESMNKVEVTLAVYAEMQKAQKQRQDELEARISRHEADPYPHARLRLQQQDMNKGGK